MLLLGRLCVSPKINEAVAYILKNVPEARNNNNLLVALFWQVFEGIDLSPELVKQLILATSIESIVRAKRRILEDKNNDITF